MEKLAIYGGGGFGKDVTVIIKDINKVKKKFDFIGYFDDNPTNNISETYLGGLNELNNLKEKINIVLAFGSSNTLVNISTKIHNTNVHFPNIIHPSCEIDYDTLTIGIGNVINVGTVISRDVSLGSFNIINSHCILGHDVVMESYNILSPQVSLSGNVKVQNKVFVGLNASVIQNITLEEDAFIGAKSLVLKKAKKGRSYFGIPALATKK